MQENTPKSEEISDIDRFERSEYTFNINSVISSNKTKGFERVKPSDIKSTLDKQFKEGKPMGHSTGLESLDKHFRWRRNGGFYLLTGYEHQGKSSFLKYIITRKGQLYNTKSVLFSPEEDVEDIMEDLARIFLRKNTNKTFKTASQCSEEEWNIALNWIEEHITLLTFDGMVDFRTLLEEYSALAKIGYSDFVTDPWNYVAEGAFDSTGINFLRVALSHMKTFANRYRVHNLVVEHQNNPRPLKDGSIPRANRFNITGGSMWRNKADSIIIFHNNWEQGVDIEIAKNKQPMYNGLKGEITLMFDVPTGHYLENSLSNNGQQMKQDKVPF